MKLKLGDIIKDEMGTRLKTKAISNDGILFDIIKINGVLVQPESYHFVPTENFESVIFQSFYSIENKRSLRKLMEYING